MTTQISEELKKTLEESTLAIHAGSIVEGQVIELKKAALYIDLGLYGTGLIFGREYINARDIIKNIRVGDMIKAKIVEVQNAEGYTELSLKEARQALVWKEAEEAMKKAEVLELPVKEANKGGLIIEWRGIQGFLPASQLKPEHYPRVEGSDKDKILGELKKFVGEKLSVIVISINPQEDKLVFSEKATNQEERKETVSKYALGDDLECEVAGVVDFGIFLKIEEGLEGLVHISEIDWGLIEDPRKLFKVGDKVKARIIEIKDGKISLSLKVFKENPWTEFDGKLKKGDIVSGVVIKFNKHGALVSIKDGVAGLVHNSSFGTEEKLREALELGKSYNFQINIFEPKDQKMTLAFVENK
jgi:ribosomal protein S1